MRISFINKHCILIKNIFIIVFACIAITGCKKDYGSGVEIYLLKSFTTTVNTTNLPGTVSITNPVLENEPLVTNEDIQFYTQATTTFTVRNGDALHATIKDFGQSKAFAVTVDKKPVYYGRFHPPYLSSMTIGIATMYPFVINNDLAINFILIDGNDMLNKLDKRNDKELIKALKSMNKLR